MNATLSYSIVGNKKSVSSTLSGYSPSQEVRELTQKVKADYAIGDEVINRPFEEFNGVSLIERMNQDQTAWLSWNPQPSQDPEGGWRFSGIRPMTRNKVISTAAHLTSQLVIPMIHAQNDKDEDDRYAAYVMRDLLEFNIKRSNYELAFLYGVISALVNPVTYFKVCYSTAKQEIWKKKKKVEVDDDELSGFQFYLVPADEIFIGNPYVFDLQKQPFVIHKRLISFDEAQGLYEKHKNWKFVRPGIKSVFNADNGLFYDVEDPNDILVEEVTYYCRRKDTQCVFVNGIYMSNDNVEYNPFIHRTNEDKPKYPFVKMGAEPIDGMRFFAYKSLVAKLQNDQEGLDRAWQMYHDANFLATYPPTITIGAGKIDKSVIVPATNTDLKKDASITPLNIVNPAHMQASIFEFERSINDSSQDPQLQGNQGKQPQTARQSILIQQNAQTNLGIMGKMIGAAVKEIGELMLDDVIRFQTIGKTEEILGGIPKMKFRTFVIPNKTVEGRNTTEVIRFKEDMLGLEMTEDEKSQKELEMYAETGDERHIYDVNPELFARMSYLISVDYEQMMQRNSNFEKAFKLETYDRAIDNPLILNDPEKAALITRDFLMEPLVGGDAEKYVPDVQRNMQQAAALLTPQTQGNGLAQRVTQSGALEPTMAQ
mgnify:CR=1 FL=1